MMHCPGCFKLAEKTFCAKCRKRLFDGGKVPFTLPFSRPEFDRIRLAISPARLSISGIQPEFSLALVDGQLKMVESGGQYILKPRPHGIFERLEVAPINEHLTMQIARQVFGIEVADNALVQFQDGELAYLVRRFDVQPDGKRSLQEDFAQIAARTEETHGKNYKYDYTYEEIGELIRKFVGTFKVDLERFFKVVVFNYLFHNSDAHLKNFSLIRNEQTGEYNLSPAYDLLNTRLHLPHESPMALELFKDGFATESYRIKSFYAYDDFIAFARKLGLVEARAQRFLKSIASKRDDAFSLIDRALLPDDCKQLYRAHLEDRIRACSDS